MAGLARLLGLALVTALALSTSAAAGTPFTVGTGDFADVAARSDNGDAYVAWTRDDSRLDFCLVPRGATGCTPKSLPLPSSTPGQVTEQPVIAVDPANQNNVSIIQVHHALGVPRVYQWTSTDGGGNFSTPSTPIAANAGLNEGTAISSPGSGFMIVELNDTTPSYQYAPHSGGQSEVADLKNPSALFFSRGTVGQSGNTPIVVGQHGEQLAYWQYSGSTADFTQTNNEDNWSAAPQDAGPGTWPRLASGPSGLFLLYYDSGEQRFESREFNAGFGPPAVVADHADPASVAATDLVHYAPNRLHAVWSVAGNTLRVSSSSDRGATWSSPIDIVRGEHGFELQAAAAPDGQGLAVWASDGNIRAASLDPAPPGDTGQPPAGGGDPTPNPNAGNGGRPQPISTTTIGNTEVIFWAPVGCVPAGERVTLRVTSKKKRRVAGRRGRSKIRKVIFRVDRRKKTDRKAAFRKHFSTAGMAPGSVHRLRAKVFLRQILPPRRRYKRTLKGTLTICP